jgi:HD-like signal output (HDOD) protein
MRDTWEMSFAGGGEDALRELERAEFDVVVSDMRMPRVDGVALLGAVKERWPGTVRIVLSGEADRETAMRTVRVAHQFLAKPCESAALRGVIERSCALRQLLDSDALRAIVGGADSLPGMPRVYSALELALSRSGSTVTEVAAIIRQDVAITAKLLQLCNSSFFGLKREITDVEQALNYLGMSVIRSLVLSHEIVASMSVGRPAGFSPERHQEHSLLVAAIARRMPLPRRESDDAFMAGMLHDLGKLLIATRAPVRYREAYDVAVRHELPLHVSERTLYGATHAEAGAALLGLWGLPDSIVSGVANHHEPSRAGAATLDLVGAVHIADALANELEPGIAGRPPVPLDMEFVESIGCKGRLDEWRRIARENVSAGTF